MIHSKKLNFNCIWKRTAGVILSAVILFSNMESQLDVQAAETSTQEDDLKENIEQITYLLEDAIQSAYEKRLDELKEMIVNDELDYYLTLESFYQQGNPYAGADYMAYIAAYASAKDICNTLDIADFYSLDFIQMDIEVKEIEEYTPLQIQTYDLQEDGTYREGDLEIIYEPIDMISVTEVEDGVYEKTGTQTIVPEQKTTCYGEVTLCGISIEDIFGIYGLDNDDTLQDIYAEKYAKMDAVINPKGLSESIFLSVSSEYLSEEMQEYISDLLADEDLSYDRKDLISTAVSLVGKVPYQWGGKARYAGYDVSWWTIGDDGVQKGLDCSGFVQWAFLSKSTSASFYKKFISTSTMLENTQAITKTQLEPGDLGFLYSGSDDQVNHVGIYLGNGLWVHCSSAAGTVTVSKTDMFKIYRRMPDESNYEFTEDTKEETFDEKEYECDFVEIDPEETYAYQDDCPYTDEEIYLTAQLVYNEASGEGLNGWIGVAEVVKNRVESELFPNTIAGVIYAEGQFANSENITKRTPTDEMITVVKQVLSGNLAILKNKEVLYFRNAGGSTDDWGNYKYFGTINSHQFYLQPVESDWRRETEEVQVQ